MCVCVVLFDNTFSHRASFLEEHVIILSVVFAVQREQVTGTEGESR